MNTKNERDLIEFADIIRNECPSATLEDVIELCKRARTSHLYAEDACNYGLTPIQERNDTNNDKKAHEIVNKWGMQLDINGDPRGAVYKIILPSGKSNSFGGIGWCVPEIKL